MAAPAAGTPMTSQYRHVVMIGMMGVGKSTVGRRVAARLGWGYWDNDEALEAATGTTAGELQRRRGQAALHATENRLLREALQTHDERCSRRRAASCSSPSCWRAS